MQVLGYEGAWGSVFMAVLGLPLAWLMPGNDIGKAYYSTTLHRVALLDIGMPCSSQANFYAVAHRKQMCSWLLRSTAYGSLQEHLRGL